MSEIQFTICLQFLQNVGDIPKITPAKRRRLTPTKRWEKYINIIYKYNI